MHTLSDLSNKQMGAIQMAYRNGFVTTQLCAWQTIGALVRTGWLKPVDGAEPAYLGLGAAKCSGGAARVRYILSQLAVQQIVTILEQR